MITLNRLKELLYYNPEIGIFVWLNSSIGAGCIHLNGYRRIKIDGKLYLVQRLAWFYMTGKWPKNDVDHINGIRNDNRWCNLREASRGETCRNRLVQKRTKSGIKGVHWREDAKKWRAGIRVEGRLIHLGYFHTKEDAHNAYCIAARKYFGEFANFG